MFLCVFLFVGHPATTSQRLFQSVSTHGIFLLLIVESIDDFKLEIHSSDILHLIIYIRDFTLQFFFFEFSKLEGFLKY